MAHSDIALPDAGTQPGIAGLDASFRFVPNELTGKCRTLIESYHAAHGYSCLPDVLWQSNARDLIRRHRQLGKIFKSASKVRSAKHANDSLLSIATAVVSLEVLARDFVGWGKQFPDAKQEAERLLGTFQHAQRIWLMDTYVRPPLSIHHELTGPFVQSANTNGRSRFKQPAE